MSQDIFDNPEVTKALEEGFAKYQNANGGEAMSGKHARSSVAECETLAQIKGLSRDDLEVLYAFGFNMLTAGETQKAEDIFLQLCMLDPLEAKHHYCLGVVRQMKKRWLLAVDDFHRFLAMDATNPEGYLRIGECEVALGNHQSARDYFETALANAQNGHGPKDAAAQAERALETVS